MAQFELQHLLPEHFKIIELAVEGHDRKTIAQATNRTPQSVSLILNSPIVQHRVAELREKREKVVSEQLAVGVSRAQQILEEASVQAANTHVDLLQHDDARIRQNSANAILDRVLETRGGNAPVVMIGVENLQLLQVALSESSSFRKKPEPEPEAA